MYNYNKSAKNTGLGMNESNRVFTQDSYKLTLVRVRSAWEFFTYTLDQHESCPHIPIYTYFQPTD